MKNTCTDLKSFRLLNQTDFENRNIIFKNNCIQKMCLFLFNHIIKAENSLFQKIST
jgi:hypothetical protein